MLAIPLRLAPAIVLAAAALASTSLSAGAAAEKTVFVSALDAEGRPVTDLTPSHFRVREDGVDREILDVVPATAPLQVALLADTTNEADKVLRDLRLSLGAFVTRLHQAAPGSAIALSEFGQAAVTIVPFVTAAEPLEAAIDRLVARPNAPSVLMEAITDASHRLAKRPSLRRAIVSLNLEPSNEQSREEPRLVDLALRHSGAQLWSVSLQRGALRNVNRDVMLDALARNTGGAREFIVGISALSSVLERFADALAAQYEITYLRPGSSAQIVQVGIVRPGVKVHASAFAPE